MGARFHFNLTELFWGAFTGPYSHTYIHSTKNRKLAVNSPHISYLQVARKDIQVISNICNLSMCVYVVDAIIEKYHDNGAG